MTNPRHSPRANPLRLRQPAAAAEDGEAPVAREDQVAPVGLEVRVHREAVNRRDKPKL